MDTETVNRIITILEESGREVARAGFAAAVKATIISGVLDILIGIAVIVLLVLFFRWSRGAIRNDEDRSYTRVWVVFLCSLAIAISWYMGLMNILAPEWMALKAILAAAGLGG